MNTSTPGIFNIGNTNQNNFNQNNFNPHQMNQPPSLTYNGDPNLQPFVLNGPKSGTSILALKNMAKNKQHQSNQSNQSNQYNPINQPNQFNQSNQPNQLNQPNQPNQLNQPNQPNQPNQINQINQLNNHNSLQHQKKYSDNILNDDHIEIYNDLSSLIDSDDSELNNIKYLVKDINKGLVDYEPSKIILSDSSEEDIENKINELNELNETKINGTKKNIKQSNIFGYFKEVCLILFLYLLISQPFIKKGITSIISPNILINKSESYTFVGQCILGLILSITFIFFKFALFFENK